MKIEKIKFPNLQEITSLIEDKTGNTYFLTSEVSKLLNHTNLKQSANRLLFSNEYFVINKSSRKDIFSFLLENEIIPNKAQRISLITIEGLIKLVLNTDKVYEKMEFISFLKHKGFIDSDYVFIKNRQEIEFSSLLIPFINAYGYTVETQYVFNKYRLDFFIKELNLCIEFDEENHIYKKLSDNKRDAYLNKFNIKTIRISSKKEFGRSLAYISLFLKHL